MDSWRDSTKKQYATYLNKWDHYCDTHHVSFLRPTLAQTLDFLTLQFDSGLGYSAINTARSALASVITLADSDLCLGQHPTTTRYLRGVFNNKPSLPRYTDTWDVSLVFNYIRNIPVNNNNMCLKDLTLKLTMLLSVLSAQRLQTLHQLKVSALTIKENKCVFALDELLKQSRPGKHLTHISYQAYPEDTSLCIVQTLGVYLQRTKELRQCDYLLISYAKPHKRISRDTIARWLKSMLTSAGVNVNKYKAHSIRSAAASNEKQRGVPIKDIMATVGWSSERTFAKFYDKDVNNK